MKKSDLKKLALMGIAGGIMLASEAGASIVDNNTTAHLLAQSGCKTCGSLADNQNWGGHSCGGGMNTGYTPPSQGCSTPQSYQQPYYPQAQMGQETAYEPRGQSYGSDQQWGSGSQWTNQGNSQQWGGQGQGRGSQQQWSGQDQSGSGMGGWSNGRYTSDTAKTATRNMTANELESELSSQGRALYQSLSPEGKAMALKLANQNCKGQNECKGLNSCKTDEHTCAGKGSCAGTAGCNYKDKNTAIRVAAMKMAEKRARMNRN